MSFFVEHVDIGALRTQFPLGTKELSDEEIRAMAPLELQKRFDPALDHEIVENVPVEDCAVCGERFICGVLNAAIEERIRTGRAHLVPPSLNVMLLVK